MDTYAGLPVTTIDTDDPAQRPEYVGDCLPRPPELAYGAKKTRDLGLIPIEAGLDDIMRFEAIPDSIARCEEDRIYPICHKKDWTTNPEQHDQDGLGYCWTAGATAAFCDLRAALKLDPIPFAWVSMGYLVGWQDRGNYIASVVNGLIKDGILPAEWVDGDPNSTNRNPRSYRQGHEQERGKWKLASVWDTNAAGGDREMARQCATGLDRGRPIEVAYNWWGHALEMCALQEAPGEYLGLAVLNHNSHRDGIIRLVGSRAWPDEAIIFESMKPSER